MVKEDVCNSQGNPIFVQALWRTSSTYTLSKFRAEEGLYCFTKPFHHDLEKSPPELKKAFESSAKRHGFPFIDRDYYEEFEAGENGVPGYDWRFSTKDYVMGSDTQHPAMERYVGSLIDKARSKCKRPMFQLNRGVLRGQWLQERFDGVSVYVSRSPVKMLASYERLAQQRQQYYMACYMGILGQNRDNPLLTEMADHVGAPDKVSESYRRHFMFYNRLACSLHDQQARDVVSFFWALGLVNASRYAETVLDMELQNERKGKTSQIFHQEVKDATGLSIDFSDLNSIGDEGVLKTSDTVRKITRNAVEAIDPDWRKLQSFHLADSTRRQLNACLG